MKIIRAEEARKIAKENSVLLEEHLNKIFERIKHAAKAGLFVLYYNSEISDCAIIGSIIEQLHSCGYKVESCSIKDINLTIKW